MAVSWFIRIALASLRDESGQDFFEYILIVAGVAVVAAGVLIVGFGFIVPEVLDSMCPAVDPLGGGDPCVIR
jgi:hypothetical protein